MGNKEKTVDMIEKVIAILEEHIYICSGCGTKFDKAPKEFSYDEPEFDYIYCPYCGGKINDRENIHLSWKID